jgi:N6-adenosine-specific RNA methylase IME4
VSGIEPYPSGRFAAIMADPPWPYATYSAKGKGRSAEAHYDAMSIDDICRLPVGSWAAPDCVLFLWITKPQLMTAAAVLEAWGFSYRTNAFTWVKVYPEARAALLERPPRYFFGLGKWTRANPEQCLLAARGHPRRLNKDVPELIVSPIREHSRKPDDVYERIERLVAGPYLELFARTGAHRPGWTPWVGKAASEVRRWRSNSYPGASGAL